MKENIDLADNALINKYENKIISIAGAWRYELDLEDVGIKEKWFDKVLKNEGFKLPGTTNENKVGEALNMEPILTKQAVRGLRQRYRYVGAAFYQREINIPEDWTNKNIILFLERIMVESRVWINGKEVGFKDSLTTPHIHDITDYVTAGSTARLTIRIDNRDLKNLGTYGHSYTEETQSIWNGIVGRIELQAVDKLFIEQIQAFPDIKNKKVKVKVTINNKTGRSIDLHITVNASSVNLSQKHKVQPMEQAFKIKTSRETFEFDYKMGEDFLLWDEFSPAVYDLDILISPDKEDKKYLHKKSITFGMREFKAVETQFSINDRKLLLRGTLDCCIYPLTGYPPTDVPAWTKVFKVVKDYGLNHVRFHSWCPPEAAFIAADEVGIYLQVEGPIWLDTWIIPVGGYEEHYEYLPKEALRISETYGNHPSFCLFSNGNELNGDFKLLQVIVEKVKSIDSRRVYTLTTNFDRPLEAIEDYFAAASVEGNRIRGNYYKKQLVETTKLDYTSGVESRNVPIISHEVGQFCVYPNMAEISKYTGNLRPINLEAIKNDLIKKDMLEYADKFTEGSGKLTVQLYKDEIEAALRTKGFGGFQLLDLHDFPGQCTATVGILDAFWESKGLIKPEEFRNFCSETVPLLRMDKRIYKNTEKLSASIEVAYFGKAEIKDAVVEWKIINKTNTAIYKGEFNIKAIPTGNNTKIGNINELALEKITEASELTFIVAIKGTEYSNWWNIWVYPERIDNYEEEKLMQKGNIIITSVFDEETEKNLMEGRNVLLLPSKEAFLNKETYPGSFYPVFWSPVFFSSKEPCGIYCEDKHPIFKNFPTSYYSSYQWKNILENSISVSLTELPIEFKPIVQVIPNYFTNCRLGNLFEAKAGKGKLIICSMDIESELQTRNEARQLRYSILSYMCSQEFTPAQSLSMDNIKSIFIGNEKLEANSDEKLGEDLALGKPVITDSEASKENSAAKGNDGDEKTRWSAADWKVGHFWQVDLGKQYDITATKVVFEKPANYLYVIYVSEDGCNWRVVANQTSQVDEDQTRIDRFEEKGRYVKIIYNGPVGLWASHYEFAVYGKEI